MRKAARELQLDIDEADLPADVSGLLRQQLVVASEHIEQGLSKATASVRHFSMEQRLEGKGYCITIIANNKSSKGWLSNVLKLLGVS
ncbi:hypothetical protein PsAD26_00323 [Pseudovibrio sp. Ad26]|nr:hypothetical protein PsAD26_00323 [Pseudovibrio sp. Ad26]